MESRGGEQKPTPTENNTEMKYDYWTLKEKEFFKGVEKPESKPQLVSGEQNPQKY